MKWLTSGFPVMLDEAGRTVRVGRTLGFAREPFMLGLYGIRPWSQPASIRKRFGDLAVSTKDKALTFSLAMPSRNMAPYIGSRFDPSSISPV